MANAHQPSSASSLQSRIAALSPEQQQLFRKQLEAKGISWDQAVSAESSHKNSNHTAPKETGPSRNNAPPKKSERKAVDKLPLSASQKHLWVLHQLYPDTSAYHISLALEMKGEIDSAGLRRSIQNIVNRHDSLRMVFLQANSQPYIQVLSAVEIDLPVTDLRSEEALKEASKETHKEDTQKSIENCLEKLRKKAAKDSFDLEKGPLIRTHLVRKSENSYELILVLHHLIADGWSRGIFLRELAAHYRSYVGKTGNETGESASLPEMTAQYSDYVLQQQDWLRSDACQQQRAYWERQLANLSELDLPSDRLPGTDFTSQTCIQAFSTAQTQSVKALARRSGVTVFMWLLAVFKLLIYRYSGQRDIAVGVPVAGRNTMAVEPLIGFFVNTLVLRSQINPIQTFPAWLKQVQSTLSDAIAHQDIPFSEVVDAAETERIPGRNPLFRVMFQVQSEGYQLQNAEQMELGIPGVSLTQRWIEPGETKFDMSWHVIERDGALVVAVEYRTELFERDRISRMLDHFHKLVDAVIADPVQLLTQYSLLPESEKEEILETWHQPKADQSDTILFPTRFEQQVKKTPEAVAVCDYAVCDYSESYKQLTYQQLNQRANQLAHWLRCQGVGMETLVGICLSPGTDLITALLAVLKAGGAYLPLDPALPTERLRYMLQDSKPVVLLGHHDCLDKGLYKELDTINSGSILYLDEPNSQLSTQPTANLERNELTAESLAYVIYTSGSTGQPKGTQLTHGGFINYLDWCLKAYPISEGCGAPVQSSVGFDATITSLFSPLLAGKQVAFGLDKKGKTGEEAAGETAEIEAIQAALSGGFSFIKLTPAHLSALQPLLEVQELDRAKLPKALVIGGEALKAHHISTWRKLYPEVMLFNEYGPTEATVGCCVHQVDVHQTTSSEQNIGNIPIGYPIDGAQLYVLDESGQPVPVGVPGELYIGGVGVARGYLNRDALTAERFIEGKYKTGDRVAYRVDGSLEYFGRLDSQIKLRGFRIEPGEIESALCQHSQVEQAVVVLHKKIATESVKDKEDRDRQVLVAYVTTKAAEKNAEKTAEMSGVSEHLIGELRSHLKEALPSYMVPAHIICLKALPLTINGKLDRQALPTPESVAANRPTKGLIQPRDRKEEIIATIWQQILNQDNLSIHDNFFDLGGDSISGMQIVSKAREQGLHLTPSQLFQYQTIAEQAAIAQEKTTLCTTATPTSGFFSLSPIQQDFFAQNLANPHHYNQAVMLEVDSTTELSILQTALTALAQHHDSLRLRFEKDSQNIWTQRYETIDSVSVPLDEFDLASRKTSEKASLDETVSKLQASLNIAEGPLFRGALLTLGAGKRLLLVAHHLLVDGVSWRILLSDLAIAYQQLIDSKPVELPAKTTAFGYWTNHLKEVASKRVIQSEKPYWTNVCRPVSQLPVDELSGSNTVSDSHEIVVTLDETQTSQIQTANKPVDVLLLTALAQTLKQWSQTSTLAVDVEGHGRHGWDDSIDISRTVGWFTALYPLRLSLSSGSMSEQIAQVQAQLKQVPNHGLGYGILRSNEVSSEISSPAQVSFNYLGQLNVDKTGFIAGLATEYVDETKDPRNQRRYLFEVIASIQTNKLQIIWRYSQQQYRLSTVQQLAQQFHSNVCSLIAKEESGKEDIAKKESSAEAAPSSANFSAAKFSAARVDADQLSQLMGKLQARGGQVS